MNVLEDKTGHGISTGNGVVTLDVAPDDHRASAPQLGLPPDALAQAAGQGRDGHADEVGPALGRADRRPGRAHVLSVWLLVGVLVLYGLAIYLARGARRATLRNAGIGFALVGLLVLVIRHLLGNYLVDSLASPGYQPATHRLYLIGTSILGQIGAAALLYGAIAALGAVFAGPSAARRLAPPEARPDLNERQGIVWGGVGFIYLLLVLWGGTHALRDLVGHPAPRRPDRDRRRRPASPDPDRVPAGTAARARRLRGSAPATGELARLQELHEAGTISDDEFVERAKKLAAT